MKGNQKMSKNNNNAYVEVKKENGFEHIYITVDGFVLQVRPIKYNAKCIYKLSKLLKGE